MATNEKISDALLAELSERAANGETYDQLTGWLAQVHGVRVSNATLSRWLAKWRSRSVEQAQAKVQKVAAEALPADLVEYDRLIRAARRYRIRAEREGELRTAIYALRVQGMLLDKRIDRAVDLGVGKEKPKADTGEKLLSKIEQLIEKEQAAVH